MLGQGQSKFASIIVRIFNLFLLSLLYIFLCYIFIENKEIAKLVPHSKVRSIAFIIGYCVALSSVDYYLAIKGNNFTDWMTEIAVLLVFIVLIVSYLGAELFKTPVTIVQKKYWFFSSTKIAGYIYDDFYRKILILEYFLVPFVLVKLFLLKRRLNKQN